MVEQQIRKLKYAGKLVIRRIAKFLVKKYVSNNWIRQSYSIVRNISANMVYPVLPKFHELIFVTLNLHLRKQYLHRDRSSRLFICRSRDLYQTANSLPIGFTPKVSIIVPNHNKQAYFLRQRLDSIYRQTYSNFEVILLDDSSSVESREILLEYKDRFPDITTYVLKDGSEEQFPRLRTAFALAKGELLWVAENDSYCSENLLVELVKYFFNEAVMLAYCNSIAEGEPELTESLLKLNSELWASSSVMSSHQLVNKAWAFQNIIPNAGSVVFRHPGDFSWLDNENWRSVRLFESWIFFLHIIRGGLVAYSSLATNYYRSCHANLVSLSDENYYYEHERIVQEVRTLYRLEDKTSQTRTFWESRDHSLFKTFQDGEQVQCLSVTRKPNLLMVAYALTAGGGETFPIKLANMLKLAGYGITFLNCYKAPTEIGVRRMLRADIPLLELDTLEKVQDVVRDMGIDLVHSHHIWADVCVCNFLEHNQNCGLIITTHGIYEMTNRVELAQIFPLLRKRVNRFVYVTKKNLPIFQSNNFDMKKFVKIDNAVEILPITPIARGELGVPENAFLICLVSRAIPEKGWQEAIEAVKLARDISKKDIHLLLIGAGPEYERLKRIVREKFIHLLGFRANVRDYFATSNLGLLPSRYVGESFPLVLIECLHAHRPVLASNVGEVKSMISTSTGPAGSIFELNNWNIPIARMVEMIVSYLENDMLYLEHLRNSKAAATKFDPIALRNKYEAVYLDLYHETSALPI